jgi:D-alanyl-lipoteichoic acid acyltransferase DltB (MBOAT superfamily)
VNYTSLEFFLLFTVTLLMYSLARSERLRFWILLVSSLFFYYWAGAFDFIIFCAVVLIAYLSALLARVCPARRKIFIYAGVGVLCLHLFAWKYFAWVASFAGFEVHLPLPLGISFFTLQGVAYLVDLSRREAEFLSLREFFLFKSFFAQLIAGPIVRAYEVVPYLKHPPRAKVEQVLEGLFRIGLGLVKKCVIADHMSIFVETVFSNPGHFTPETLMLGGMAFYFQIWGDFSGYTDIGRGCALLLGWRLPENFYSPVYALGPTEWARRWHVTLGRWMLLYVYVPIAKQIRRWTDSRLTKQMGALAVTLVAVGLWHGAAINFLLYGLGLSAGFFCEVLVRRNHKLFNFMPGWAQSLLAWSIFFPYEIVMSIIFRSESLIKMTEHFGGILSPHEASITLLPYSGSVIYRILFVFVLEAIMFFNLRERRFPVAGLLSQWVRPIFERYPRMSLLSAGLALGILFVAALALRSTDQINGFIYFRF